VGLRVHFLRALILLLFLLAWQYLPSVKALSSRFHFLDRYFVSSPVLIAQELYDLFSGHNTTFTIWQYIWPTLLASAVGMVVGLVLGALLGLLLSNSATATAVLRPYLVVINSIPRIALIPIAIIIFGPTLTSSMVLSVTVVFFIVFWNAYEGGLSIAEQTVQNAKLLGANSRQTTLWIRSPYVLAWTFAALPNAVTFAFLSVVTTEVLIGSSGLGFLINQSITTADSTLTFSVAVVLAVLGLAVVGLAELARRKILHWWRPVSS
jgi:NitT/TauT family transport system permease protein